MTKKVLIVYASAGAGHVKAAEAIYNSFKRLDLPGAQIEKIDALNFTNFVFKWSYPRVYIFLVTYLSFFWGVCFHFLNLWHLRKPVGFVRHILNYLNGEKLVNYIIAQQPDVVICVHFFSAELIAKLRESGAFKGKMVCCVTDFGVHQFWINPGTDYYLVASEKTKAELTAKEIPAEKILVFGIPIGNNFSGPFSKEEIRQKLGFAADKITILVTSGGFGVGPIQQIVKTLDEIGLDLQILVICGQNLRLYNYFKSLKFNKDVRVFSYVTNMDEFMSAADLIISKSGGLTVSEALAKNLPMIIIRPIPGQETANAEFLESFGAGIRLKNINELNKQVNILCADNLKKLKAMRANTAKLARPHSADDICRWIIKEISGKTV